MARSIYITSAEGNTGKSTIALGVLETLTRSTERVGVFRPIARSSTERDYVLELLLDHDGVDLALLPAAEHPGGQAGLKRVRRKRARFRRPNALQNI